MYSQAINEQKIDTMSRTKVMIVTMNGSAMPATLKKYCMISVSGVPHFEFSLKLTVE